MLGDHYHDTTCHTCGASWVCQEHEGCPGQEGTCPECLEVLETIERVHEITERLRRAADERAYRLLQARQNLRLASND